MTLRSLFLILTILMPAGQILAMENAARLHVKSEGEAAIELTGKSEEAKAPIIAPKAFSVDFPVVADKWTTCRVTFKVAGPTILKVRLSGSWLKEGDNLVFIDDIKATGLNIVNPDFEVDAFKNTAPAGWQFWQQGAPWAIWMRDRAAAASGEIFVKVSHACPAVQRVQVPQATEVTISFAARLAPK